MITVDELVSGRDVPEPMLVTVKQVDTDVKGRRAELEVSDTEGNTFDLIDYKGANLAVDWKVHHRYQIAHCPVEKYNGRVVLTPSKKTEVSHLGPVSTASQILIVGDTHIGRTRHPKTGVKIDPIDAFDRLVNRGIGSEVDAVIHVGDIFHESATSKHAESVANRILDPLGELKIPFYYVKGNHQSEAAKRVLDRETRDNVHNLNMAGVDIGGEVCIYGINHHENGDIPWSKLDFPTTMDEQCSILVLHQTIEQLSDTSREGSIDLNQILRRVPRELDLVISGHHHSALIDSWQGMKLMYTGATEHMSRMADPIDRVGWIVEVDSRSVSINRYDIPE